MIPRLSFPLIVSLICLSLASCATIEEQAIIKDASTIRPPITWPSTTEPPNWLGEQKKRQKIKIWEIRGRLGVQTKTNGGSVDITWKQSEQEYSIRLIAPLGAGNYLILGNEEYADVRFPDGRKETIDNVDQAFSSTLQVNLPVTAIRYWLRGLPAKGLPVTSISWNNKGLIERLKQSGWNVEMKKYMGAKVLMPHSIYLSRDDDPELDIRLVLRQWLVDSE